MKHVFSISFEILGSHAQITEMKFTCVTYRTRLFLLTELPEVSMNIYAGEIVYFVLISEFRLKVKIIGVCLYVF